MMPRRICALIAVTSTSALVAQKTPHTRLGPRWSTYVEEKRGALGSFVTNLEDECAAGDDESCRMLDQLSGYAQALGDLQKRRTRAPDAPDILADSLADVSTVPRPRAAAAGAKAEGVDPDSVSGALVKLFDAYDTRGDGAVPVDVFTSRWVSSQIESDAKGAKLTGASREWDWSARQARAGARRIAKLFAHAETVSQRDFVATFEAEYAKRVERGLPVSRAIAEIFTNMPQRELYAEMYGSE